MNILLLFLALAIILAFDIPILKKTKNKKRAIATYAFIITVSMILAIIQLVNHDLPSITEILESIFFKD